MKEDAPVTGFWVPHMAPYPLHTTEIVGELHRAYINFPGDLFR